jgi:hypothetical protein
MKFMQSSPQYNNQYVTEIKFQNWYTWNSETELKNSILLLQITHRVPDNRHKLVNVYREIINASIYFERKEIHKCRP